MKVSATFVAALAAIGFAATPCTADTNSVLENEHFGRVGQRHRLCPAAYEFHTKRKSHSWN